MIKPTVWIGCGVVVQDDADRMLLVIEGGGPTPGKWSFPAGKLEFGETLQAAAIRETREETGLDVALDSLIGVYHSPTTGVGSYGVNFVFRGTETGGRLTPSPDHPEVRFVPRNEVDQMVADGRFRSTDLIRQIMIDVDLGRSLPLDFVQTTHTT